MGRLSQLKISQDHHRFKVEIDGNVCFQTDKVQLPIDYTWGVSAVSAETPDSFEINALKVTAHTYNFDASNAPPEAGEAAKPPAPGGNDGKKGRLQSIFGRAAPLEDPKETKASDVPVDEQFADLHNRLAGVQGHMGSNHIAIMEANKKLEDKLADFESILKKLNPSNPVDEIKHLKEKLEAMETRIQHIQTAVGDNWHIEDLKRTVQESHSTLAKNTPGLGKLIFVIVGSQAVLVGLYVAYMRRRENMPKKYL
jgi:mannose-binding lectin 1